MYNLEKAHYIVQEIILNGCIMETNRVNILNNVYLIDKSEK